MPYPFLRIFHRNLAGYGLRAMSGGGGPALHNAHGASRSSPVGTRQTSWRNAAGGGRRRSYLIVEGYSTEVEIITQAEAWLLLGRAAHTALPIP